MIKNGIKWHGIWARGLKEQIKVQIVCHIMFNYLFLLLLKRFQFELKNWRKWRIAVVIPYKKEFQYFVLAENFPDTVKAKRN